MNPLEITRHVYDGILHTISHLQTDTYACKGRTLIVFLSRLGATRNKHTHHFEGDIFNARHNDFKARLPESDKKPLNFT